MKNGILFTILLYLSLTPLICRAQIIVPIDKGDYNPDCGISISYDKNELTANWDLNERESAVLSLDLNSSTPLIKEISIDERSREKRSTVATLANPAFILTVGERDLQKRNGWTIFFDRVHHRPYDSYIANISPGRVKVTSQGRRCFIEIDSLYAGPYSGKLVFSLYANSPLIHVEAVVSSKLDAKAIVYDAGLTSSTGIWNDIVWLDTDGGLKNISTKNIIRSENIKTKLRTVIAEHEQGSIAVFPTPHQYFYPLDFSENYHYNWYGSDYRYRLEDFGFGIRLPLNGDQRYVPWFNAPPDSRQRMGFFLLATNRSAEETLDQVKLFTRDDRFKKIPGHATFSSHYHIEHTKDLIRRQPDQEYWTPSNLSIPKDLQEPEFVKVFKAMQVDIVHLAEFHFGETPGLPSNKRLPLLQVLHQECERLSDDSLLLLPGEEPNVHLGGHWISFFPKPVYWVLNNKEKEPFVKKHPDYGKIYHVNNADDVQRIFEEENGLMWTAHPRIKGSTGFPDQYNKTDFYKSDHFLGGAWKNMPADLSEERLGSRVLNLQNDMANWGEKKYILGEVDVFKVNKDHEQYAHMNINYLRLNKVPKFKEGWSSVLKALRNGAYFTTTGEVLIHEFSVDGKLSGESAKAKEQAVVHFKLEWTFPLKYVEIISGDGEQVYHERLDLSDTESFSSDTWHFDMNIKGRKWLRLEVWDIAHNGAFTPPVWLE